MDKKVQINIASAQGGLNLDKNPHDLSDGEVTYCLNGVFFSKDNSYYYRNYEGNEFCLDLPDGYLLLTGSPIDEGQQVLFLVNPNDVLNGKNNSEIGLLNPDCTYSQVVRDYCLNFQVTHQIDVEYKKTYDCKRKVYFTDNYNPRRVLDLLNPPLIKIGENEDCTPIFGGLDCDAIRLDRVFDFPCIDIEIVSGGILKTGAYFISIQYSDSNGIGLTDYSDLSNRVDIISEVNAFFTEGDAPDLPTNKAIKINLSDLDNTFDFYNIIILKQINGVLSTQKIVTLSTTVSTYTYTGLEAEILDLTVDEVVTKSVIYDTFKTVTANLGHLLWGNIHKKADYNYQPYANNIQIQWITYRVSYENYVKQNHPFFDQMNLLRDEIYPIGIQLERNTGDFTCTYHIPGREKNKTAAGGTIPGVGFSEPDQYGAFNVPHIQWDSFTINSAGNNDVLSGSNSERWEIYNTAKVVDFHQDYIDYLADGGDPDTYEGLYEYGEMSYWENNSKYPDNTEVYDNLACTNIRHHKMPDCSITHIHNNKNGTLGFGALPYIFLLGLQVNNVIIDPVLFPDIVGYRLVIGDRTIQKSIIAKGLLFNNVLQNDDSSIPDPQVPAPYLYTNWAYNDLSSATNWDDPEDIQYDNFSIWTPETTFKSANIGVLSEVKLETEEYGEADYFVTTEADTNTETNVVYAGISAYSTGWYNNYLIPTATSVRRSIDDREYILNNAYQISTLGNINNTFRESTVMFSTTNTFLGNVNPDDSKTAYDFGVNGHSRGDISSYYASLKLDSSNLWGNIDTVPYVQVFGCTEKLDHKSNGIYFGGDTFITHFSFHKRTFEGPTLTTGSFIEEIHNDFNQVNAAGELTTYIQVLANPVFLCESTVNTMYRYSGQTIKEYFYPFSETTAYHLYIWESPLYMMPTIDNYYLYNFDYSRINNINSICTQPASFDPNNCINHLFSRVIYSERDTTEGLADNWLSYPPLQYFDFKRDKGELIDMESLGQNKMIFRFEDTLFINASTQTVNTDESSFQLKTAELFNPEPNEVLSLKTGYIGTRSQWAFTNTPYGSFMIDDKRNKIFHFSDNFNPISDFKLNSYFNENLSLKLLDFYPDFNNFDNPSNPDGIGFISVYDYKNDIIIITKRDYIPANTQNPPTLDGDNFISGDQIVRLTDPAFFEDKSMTFSFSPKFNVWNSFHSFIPNGYLDGNPIFKGFINSPDLSNSSIYNFLSKNSFNQYFGIDYPFILEIPLKVENSNLNTLFWKTYAYDLNSEFEHRLVTFDSGYFYNSEQCTGNLNFTVKDSSQPLQSIQFPNVGISTTNILISKENGIWSLAYIRDKVLNRDNPQFFLNNTWTNLDYQSLYPIDKVVDNTLISYSKSPFQLKDLKGFWAKARLILNRTDVKLVTNLFLSTKRESIRN